MSIETRLAELNEDKANFLELFNCVKHGTEGAGEIIDGLYFLLRRAEKVSGYHSYVILDNKTLSFNNLKESANCTDFTPMNYKHAAKMKANLHLKYKIECEIVPLYKALDEGLRDLNSVIYSMELEYEKKRANKN